MRSRGEMRRLTLVSPLPASGPCTRFGIDLWTRPSSCGGCGVPTARRLTPCLVLVPTARSSSGSSTAVRSGFGNSTIGAAHSAGATGCSIRTGRRAGATRPTRVKPGGLSPTPQVSVSTSEPLARRAPSRPQLRATNPATRRETTSSRGRPKSTADAPEESRCPTARGSRRW